MFFLTYPLTYKQGTGNRKDLTYIMGGIKYVNWATDMLSEKQQQLPIKKTAETLRALRKEVKRYG